MKWSVQNEVDKYIYHLGISDVHNGNRCYRFGAASTLGGCGDICGGCEMRTDYRPDLVVAIIVSAIVLIYLWIVGA